MRRWIASKTDVWVVVVFGPGALLAGVFPEDYVPGTLDTAVSATAFVAIIAPGC